MWILVHNPKDDKPFLSNTNTGAVIVERDGERWLWNGQDCTYYRESLSELAQLLGAVGMGECGVCNGTGKTYQWVTDGNSFCPCKVEETCHYCDGTGRGVGPVKEVK